MNLNDYMVEKMCKRLVGESLQKIEVLYTFRTEKE